jgi:uncharacterized cupredoxin-like copper-binding protein
VKRRMLVALLLMLGVALAGCGGNGSDAGGEHADHGGTGADEGNGSVDAEGRVPGEAAAASEADAEILVVASDELTFDPATIEVEAREVVTFIVRNEGKTDHEFVLGDEAYQEMHDKDMTEGGHHMAGMENAVTVGPGETAKLTWRFSERGEVLYGCHEPGHYDGGMVGTVEVG